MPVEYHCTLYCEDLHFEGPVKSTHAVQCLPLQQMLQMDSA